MSSINRIVMQKTSRRWIDALGPGNLNTAEISGKFGRRFDFRSYRRFRYPAHDICAGPFTGDDGEVLGQDP